MKYDIKVGDLFLSNDGSKSGHIVIDVLTYSYCDDIVTQPFDQNGLYGDSTNRIDYFKLSVVRYHKSSYIPDWIPNEVFYVLGDN